MATVLVVDDEPDLRFLHQVALEAEGYQVMTAADGADALAAVQVEVPDLILLDVMMPEVDGWTVLESLKSHFDERIATVRVIMQTSLGTEEEKARGGISGAIRYLVKPVSLDDMLEAVREVLSDEAEPEQRLRAQQQALRALALLDKGVRPDEAPDAPGPRLSGLERSPRPREPDPRVEVAGQLTETQVGVLRALRSSDSVTNAAATLGVSRANIYASLRRSVRSLGLDAVPELLSLLRAGFVVLPEE